MVTFKLIERNDKRLVYCYYPEGHEDKRPGTIVVDLLREEISVTELAEEDWEREIPAKELNKLADAVNKIKRERGETDLIEPTSRPSRSIFYGDHAVREIARRFNEGDIPEKGCQMWY